MTAKQDFEALQKQVEELTRQLGELRPALNDAGKKAAQEKVEKDVLGYFKKFKKSLLDAKKSYEVMVEGMNEAEELADVKKSIEAAELEPFDRGILLDSNTRGGDFLKVLGLLSRKRGTDGNPFIRG